MNRFIRVVSSLVLIGFLGMGALGMGVCICANGHVAMELGCDGDCQGSEDAPDCEQHAGSEAPAAMIGHGDEGCIFVPLLSEAMLHSSAKAKLSLSARDLVLIMHHADYLSSGANDDDCANTSLASCASTRTSASVLAQRTIVLRI